MKKWMTISLAGAAVLLVALAILLALTSEPDDSKFVVGKALPAGRATPQISVSYMDQAVILCPDGTVWSWGGTPNRMTSQVGMQSAPQKISEDKDWRQVAIAARGIAALKNDGSLWQWDGAIRVVTSGQTKMSNRPAAPKPIGTNSDWVAVSASVSHYMALKADGSIWGWGQNESGQLGNGEINLNSGGGFVSGNTASGGALFRAGTDNDWKAISAGSFNSYALKSNGTIWGWGSKISSGTGQDNDNVVSPEQIDPGTNWIAISAGDYHLLALKSDGTIWARGQNLSLVAPAMFRTISSPGVDQRILRQIGTDTDWTQICSGQNSFFARKRDGSWWACGNDNGYHLGLGAATNTSPSGAMGRGIPSPQRLPFDFDPWAIATGGSTTVFLTKDGSLWNMGTRLGVSKSSLEAKGIKGLYNKASAWFKKNIQHKPETAQQQSLPGAGRGGVGRRGGGPGLGSSAPNDTVTDLTPYRIWSIPSDMRTTLEKEAKK